MVSRRLRADEARTVERVAMAGGHGTLSSRARALDDGSVLNVQLLKLHRGIRQCKPFTQRPVAERKRIRNAGSDAQCLVELLDEDDALGARRGIGGARPQSGRGR